VGGEKVEQTQGELGNLGPGGHIAVNQMYVRYMVPQAGDANVPVVMLHGATLTGKSWETTPDGRMGWDEYFVRRGHPVYVPDQVGRGRSGFNQAVFNNVRAGSTPPGNQPVFLRFSDESVWPNFRFGVKPGAPFADGQFPVDAADELAKQAVPDVSFGGVPTPNPTLKALSDLAGQLKGAVLMGHSQSGSFPLEAALLDPAATSGLVLVEPGRCPAYTPEQVATLAKVPILVVFGDHRDNPTGLSTLPSWQARFEACQTLIARVTIAGGQAQMLNPPERGIRGNSHMIMQDKNHLQIADLILQWIDERVRKLAAPPVATATREEEEVVALSKQKWRWMAERNVDALAALFHEKAVFVHMGGNMSKSQELDVIKGGGIQYKHAEILETSVQFIGTTAVLLNRIQLVAVVGGNEVTNPFVVTEVYVKEGGARKLASLSFTRLLTR
jgi:pimeloyl-ACP methyl ester carboxylesterase